MANDLTVGIVGSGGDGVILLGELLSKCAARSGLSVVLTKSFGPQIRGGESSCIIRLSPEPLKSFRSSIDVMLLFSPKDLTRFEEEMHFSESTLVLADASRADDLADCILPDSLKQSAVQVPLLELAMESARNKQARNMVMAGIASALLEWGTAGMEEFLRQRFARYGERVIETNLAAVSAGREHAANELAGMQLPQLTAGQQTQRMLISGDDAFALGSASAGCRFFAGYPISPASEILEWMSVNLPKLGGHSLQAEDEIAAVTMCIGASYGGVRSMTATSGPGFTLMLEAIGLAGMAEIPLVVCDVQRAGPSTGIPTRTEQADLNTALYGGHGDFPRVVLAATDIASSYEMAHRAFEIAEAYQLPVIVLLDQYLGQSVQTVELALRETQPNNAHKDNDALRNSDRLIADFKAAKDAYERFRETESGVSPAAVPGQAGGEHLLVGLAHDEEGNPATTHKVHQRQMEKRMRKLDGVREKYPLVEKYGDAKTKLGLLTWGSNFGACAEVAEGISGCAVLAPQMMMPLPAEELQQWIDACGQLIIVETSYSGQYADYLRNRLRLPETVLQYKRAGGAPISASELRSFIADNLAGMEAAEE